MFAVTDRAVACLKGVAIGDAVGKQTEMLPRDEIRRWYPHGIRGFEGIAGELIPRYRGNRKREWRIGETTDDTERTVAVARAILAEERVSHTAIGREMLQCVKCVHRGVQSLWEFHQAGDPARIATTHDGCGAAVRVSPVGILYSSMALDMLVTGAREASIPTHGGSLAIAAAAATAAAVSAAIDAATPPQILQLAVDAASQAQMRWPTAQAPSFADAIRAASENLATLDELSADRVAAVCFPTQPSTIVPLALALGTRMHSAQDAILLAANIGGDSDSVASIAGGILGARYPETINEDWFQIVETLNHHDLVPIAHELVRLRGDTGHPS